MSAMLDAQQVKQWRREMRAALIANRMAADARQRQAWSAEIERHLRPLVRRLDPKIIGFCWPFKAEFDPRPVIGNLQAGTRCKLALPAVVRPKTPMEFRPWSADAEMESGVWDIPVPKTRQTVLPDLLLVPVVGFDRENYRLGYGGGYFDRTLAVLAPRPIAVGVGFELSRLDTVYPQPFDVPMDYVVTELGVQQRGNAPGRV